MIDVQKIRHELFFSSKGRLFLFFLVSGLLYVIYGYVALSSYGYDDEFWNINLIENRSLPEVIAFVQSSDVHPPLSYILNFLLYYLLGSWSLVRLLTGTVLVSVIAWSSWRIWSVKSWVDAIVYMNFVGFSPAILMWCTSLRWYSIYLIILIALLSPSPNAADLKPRLLHLKLIISLLLLGYTGYITIVLAIPITLYYYTSDQLKWDLKSRITSAIITLSTFTLLYSHQLYIFFNFHYPNKSSQTDSIIRSLIGIFASEFSNQGIFPLSLIGLSSAIAMLVIIALSSYGCLLNIKNKSEDKGAFATYPFSIVAITASGLAAKFRNFVTVDPFRGLFFAAFLKSLGNFNRKLSLIGRLSIIIVFSAQLLGVGNVIAHNGTTKNNWNIPVGETMQILSSFSNSCPGQLAVFNHEPTFQWHLKRQGFIAFGPYDGFSNGFPEQRFECVAFINTFRGSLDRDRFEAMRKESFDLLKGSQQNQELLGFDSDYKLKQKIDSDFPPHAVNIITAKGSFDLTKLKSWTH